MKPFIKKRFLTTPLRTTDARLSAEPLPQNPGMFGSRAWTGHAQQLDDMDAESAVQAVNDAIDRLERYRANRASRDSDFANTLHGEMHPGDFGNLGTGRPEKEFGITANPRSINSLRIGGSGPAGSLQPDLVAGSQICPPP